MPKLIEAMAEAIEPLVPRQAAGNNGSIVELSNGGFVHLTTWNIAIAALKATEELTHAQGRIQTRATRCL